MDKKLKKANVLAVDDYPANIIALEAVLSGEYNVIPASSGAEAISLLAAGKNIHVILMDLQMPDMDGFEAAKKIKQIPNCSDIPIIFITAVYKEDPFIKKGYEIGAVDYFSKPFDPEILKMKVGVYAAYLQKAEVLKERERHLQETEDLLRVGRKLSTVLEGLPVGVLIADVAGRIFQTNNLVAEIFTGLQVQDHRNYGKILGWWDDEGKMIKEKDGPLYRAIHSGETTTNEPLIVKTADGTTKVLVGSASPLLGLDGHTVGAVIVLQDMTETKKIEADLEKHITKLVSAGLEIEEQLKY